MIRKWLSASNFLLLLAVLFMLFFELKGAWMLLDQGQQAVEFKYPLDYGEGPLLDQAVRLAAGENIYRRDLSTPPFNIANYPPVYMLLQVPFVWIFGPALWYGRLLSLLGVVLASLFTGLVVKTLVNDRIAGLASGLLLLSFPYVLHWSALTRIDCMALAFLMAGMFALVRHGATRKGRAWAVALLLLAAFTRQSYALAGPFAGFIFLLSQRTRRHAFIFLAWLGILGIGLVLLLILVTGGGFFTHIVTANVNAFYWETVRNYANDLWRYIPFLVCAGAGLLLSGIVKRETAWYLAAPFLLGAIASAITIGKDGSNVNYLLELCAALSLAVGVGLGYLSQRGTAVKAVLLVVLALQVQLMLAWSSATYATYHTARFNQLPQLFQLNRVIEKSPGGMMLADEYMAMLPVNGQRIVYQPFEFKMMADSDRWNQAVFLQKIVDKEYALIVLYDPPTWDSQHARWTQAQLNAIYENYELSQTLADAKVLVPKR